MTHRAVTGALEASQSMREIAASLMNAAETHLGDDAEASMSKVVQNTDRYIYGMPSVQLGWGQISNEVVVKQGWGQALESGMGGEPACLVVSLLTIASNSFLSNQAREKAIRCGRTDKLSRLPHNPSIRQFL